MPWGTGEVTEFVLQVGPEFVLGMFGFLVLLVLWIASPFWVYRNAVLQGSRRPWAWAGLALVSGPIGLAAYLVVRKAFSRP